MSGEETVAKQSPVPPWVAELTPLNFLALYDVVLDIREAGQMSGEIVISLLPTVIKFPALMPGEGINMRDDYCGKRALAVQLLEKQGTIRHYEPLEGDHRWKNQFRIDADVQSLNSFAALMDQEFTRRHQPAKKPGKPGSVVDQGKEQVVLTEIRAMLLRFHSVAIQLQKRYAQRATLVVKDEYDVQDLLHSLLNLHFDDIRPEEWTPSYAGKAARVDFLLKPERVVIEVKKTRQGLDATKLGDELIIDTARYAKHPDCGTLVCMVYDPEHRIANPVGFEADLTGRRDSLMVEVIVVPKAR